MDQQSDIPADEWALVEIMGHRRHYGRVAEVQRYGATMLRVDVPTRTAAPLLGEPETFETFFYGGAAIFSVTPMTEEAARSHAERDRPRPYTAVPRLAASYRLEAEDDDDPADFGEDEDPPEPVAEQEW